MFGLIDRLDKDMTQHIGYVVATICSIDNFSDMGTLALGFELGCDSVLVCFWGLEILHPNFHVYC